MFIYLFVFIINSTLNLDMFVNVATLLHKYTICLTIIDNHHCRHQCRTKSDIKIKIRKIQKNINNKGINT